MGSGFDWRWWLRRDCRAIAGTERLGNGGLRIVLCRRRRWHRGPCGGGAA